jgi:hypothetical protein
MNSILHPSPARHRSYGRRCGLAFLLIGVGLVVHHLLVYFPYTPGEYTDPSVYFDRSLWVASIPLVYYGSLIAAGVGLLLRARWVILELAFFGFMILESFVSVLLGWSDLPFAPVPGLLLAACLLPVIWLLYVGSSKKLWVEQLTLGTLFGLVVELLIS